MLENWIEILALALASYVTLGKALNPSELLDKGDPPSATLGDLLRVSQIQAGSNYS